MGTAAEGHPVGTITVTVADDHPAVLDAVSRFLDQNGVDVLGIADDGEEALRELERLRPAVAILDLRMPGFTGGEIIRRARAVAPDTALLVYTGLVDQETIVDALAAGADGVIEKDASMLELVRAVRLVAAGRSYVDASLAASVLQGGSFSVGLTTRELEVLRLLADGNSNESIARELHIAPDTVRAHVRKAMAKLSASTRTQAVATALRKSLIS
ncbi:MAG: response regulator transcription factor [Thermoleophilia bacterium]|nr:response regulator transcription factor [Thermoleophilia bacterium]MDH4344846.1 response regulator transcription factor [Thermoleophilia bacterium]